MAEQHRQFFNDLADRWDEMHDRSGVDLLNAIIGRLGIRPGSCVLDAGSGTGVLLPALSCAVGPDGMIVAVDIAERMLDRARQKFGRSNLFFIRADLAQTPFLDGSFDEIVCNSCFPHVTDKPGVVGEMFRILKPGGRSTVCNPMGRDVINNFHRSVGGVVADDLMPDEEEMRSLFQGHGFVDMALLDKPEEYCFTAHKPL